MRKLWLKLISLLVLAVLIVLFVRWELAALLLSGDLEALQEIAEDNLVVILPLTYLIMQIHNLLPVIPLFVVVTINVTLFGIIPGYVWSLASSVLCAVTAFAAVRFWLQDLFVGKISANLMAKIARNGFWVVFVARMIPYVPTSVMNAAAAISTISNKTFILSTIAGNAVYVLVVALISMGVMSVKIEIAALECLLVAAAVLIAWHMFKRYKNRVKRNSPNSEREKYQ